MGFIILLFLSTLAVAGSAAFFSVYGLGQIFSGAFISVLIMGGALEVGKLVAASFLYRYWKDTPKILKGYLSSAVLVLMLITSIGIFGFLTASYQVDSISLKQQQDKIVFLEEQKESYKERLTGIDQQIQAVPEDYITKRMELISTFEPEKNDILQKMDRVDEELLSLKTNVLTTEAKIGPIIYVAEVLERDPDEAVFWFVLVIVFVFDPLAVSLTLATNIALRKRKENKVVEMVEQEILESDNDMSSEDIREILEKYNIANSEIMGKISEDIANIKDQQDRANVRDNLGKVIRT